MEMFYSFTVVMATSTTLKKGVCTVCKIQPIKQSDKKIFGIKMVVFLVYLTETAKIYSGRSLKMKMEIEKHIEK